MPNNDACVGRSPLTSEVPKDRVMMILFMVGCWRTWAETGIVQTEKRSVRLVMLMINYASVERLGWRQRQSWICDTERNKKRPTLALFFLEPCLTPLLEYLVYVSAQLVCLFPFILSFYQSSNYIITITYVETVTY